MKCSNFQLNIAVEPGSWSDELRAHIAICPECAAFADDMRRLAAALTSAIALETPSNLTGKLIELPKRGRTSYWSTLALAASMLVAVGLIAFFTMQSGRYPESIQQVVYQHIMAEPEALAATQPAKQALVKTVMKDFGLQLNESIGTVTHITLCPIGDTHGLHVVLEGQAGPVTLLYIPTHEVDGKSVFHEGRFTGLIKPAPIGVLAIVGEINEPLETMDTRLQTALEWL